LQILSGDDGAHVDIPPSPSHPGFSRDVFNYDIALNRWSVVSHLPFGRATVPLVEWNGHMVMVMGEVRPRERTTEVWWSKEFRNP
jgi:N-acetylneuraminic acid mutarotase